MKESIWGYWIVVLGISVISVMVLLQSFTTTSEQDYYLVKSCLESAMYDAVDYGYYRDTSVLKMNAEKFYENFIRRFAQTVNISKDYDINFYGVTEIPPSASVSVTTVTDDTNYGTNEGSTASTNVTNRLTGILFTNENYKPKKSVASAGTKSETTTGKKSELVDGWVTSYNEIWEAHYTKGKMDSCRLKNKNKVIYYLISTKGFASVVGSDITASCALGDPLACCFNSTSETVKLKYCYIDEGDGKCSDSGTIDLSGGGMKETGYTK